MFKYHWRLITSGDKLLGIDLDNQHDHFEFKKLLVCANFVGICNSILKSATEIHLTAKIIANWSQDKILGAAE